VQVLGLIKVFKLMKKSLIIFVFAFQFVYSQQVKFFNTFGNGIYDSGEGVIVTKDSGYVVGGITNQGGVEGNNVMIYKTDSLGALQWFKNIGGAGIEGARSIACGYNNEFILAGFKNNLDSMGYDVFVVKTDLNGDTLWTRTFGGSDWDMAYSIDKLADSTYVVAGETYSFGNGNRDVYVLRINQMGDTIWTKTFGGTADDYAKYVYVDRHNNIVVIGSTESFGAGGSDLYVVYMDVNGDTIWTKAYGTVNDDYGYSGDMYIDNSNRQSFTFGYTTLSLSEGVQEMHLFRGDTVACNYVNDLGVLTQPSNPEIVDKPRVRMDARGRFYYCAELKYTLTAKPDIYLHRTLYAMNFGYAENILPQSDEDYAKDIRKSFDKGYIITGETTTYGPGITSSFILKVDSSLVSLTTALVGVDDVEKVDFNLYPNPVTNGYLFIETTHNIQQIKIYNMSGQLIQTETGLNYSNQQIIVDELIAGVYIIEIETTNGIGRKKLLIAK